MSDTRRTFPGEGQVCPWCGCELMDRGGAVQTDSGEYVYYCHWGKEQPTCFVLKQWDLMSADQRDEFGQHAPWSLIAEGLAR